MTTIGVTVEMQYKHIKPRTTKGWTGYKQSSKNSPNSLILDDEFVLWNR